MANDSSPNTGALYAGTWTEAEVNYVDALREEYTIGNLLEDMEQGTTMRSYLASKIGCHPKRVSKRYEGTGYNGRLQYRKGITAITPEEVQRRHANLLHLERKFKESRKLELLLPKSSTKTPSKTKAEKGTQATTKDDKSNTLVSEAARRPGMDAGTRQFMGDISYSTVASLAGAITAHDPNALQHWGAYTENRAMGGLVAARNILPTSHTTNPSFGHLQQIPDLFLGGSRLSRLLVNAAPATMPLGFCSSLTGGSAASHFLAASTLVRPNLLVSTSPLVQPGIPNNRAALLSGAPPVPSLAGQSSAIANQDWLQLLETKRRLEAAARLTRGEQPDNKRPRQF